MWISNKKVTKKFEKEIQALKLMGKFDNDLTPIEQAEVKTKIMRAIASPAPVVAASGFWNYKREMIARYVVSLVLGLSLIGGTAFASDGSVPGQVLYPVKLFREKVQLALSISRESKANLQAKFAEERLNELVKLSAKTPRPLFFLPPSAGNASSTATSTNPIIISPTAAIEPEEQTNNHNSPLVVQAKAEAILEVNQALGALKQVQTDFENKGDKKNAARVSSQIIKLQLGAQAQNLDVGDRDKSQSNGDKMDGGNSNKGGSNSSTATTTTASSLAPILRVRSHFKLNQDNVNIHLNVQGTSSLPIFGSEGSSNR